MIPRGILNLNKPAGITSRRAVDIVKRLVRPAKVGHAGTLDPLATGVLVVCVGAATRLIEYVGRMPKRYLGTFLLGRRSPTEDIEGEVTELPDAPVPTHAQIVAAAECFVGRIAQRPPSFSAIKVKGRRAYKLAREGQQFQLPARPVNVYRIEVKAYKYPELTLDVECGGGTYIRSLGRDLAESLGTAAVMSALTRTAIGNFRIEHSVDPNVLDGSNLTDWLQPSLAAVECLSRIRLSAEEVARVRNGQFIELPNNIVDCYKSSATTPGGVPVENAMDHIAEGRGNLVGSESVEEIAALDPAGRLVAILAGDGSDRLRPTRNMPIELPHE